MKLTIFLITAFIFTARGSGNAQTVTASFRNAPLEKVLAAVEKQTGYNFFYDARVLRNARTVTVQALNMPMKMFLKQISDELSLKFTINSRTITVAENFVMPEVQEFLDAAAGYVLTGQVLDSASNPLSGATVSLHTKSERNFLVTTTDRFGNFKFRIEQAGTLEITYVGYERYRMLIGMEKEDLVSRVFKLRPVQAVMAEVVVNRGYYTTSARLSTGTVAKITSEEIQRQPVSNPLLALQGRIPGVEIRQTDGMPASDVKISIRGTNSILQGSSPLFIIDGVPLFSANGYFPDHYGAMDGSVFANINPDYIDNIEILKDADATAIYGSRGANGVILITTKKARQGKMNVNVRAKTGISIQTYKPKLLNTQQYLALRREAFANDKVTPTAANAPDLKVWDTTKYTDWLSHAIDKTAKTTDVSASIDGRTETFQFFLGAGFHRETTTLAKELSFTRGDINLNATHQSPDKKFQAGISATYASGDQDNIPDIRDMLGKLLKLPPNAPDQFDANGNLLFTHGVSNPFAELKKPVKTKTSNLLGSFILSYQLLPSLQIKLTGGISQTRSNTVSTIPISSQDPLNLPTNSAYRNVMESRGWTVEPQINYSERFGKLKIDALVGGSLQSQFSETSNLLGRNFPNDDVLESLELAGNLFLTDNYYQYRYQALSARLGMSWDQRYVLNITARRDGSSRFGPGKRFANFGAAGLAWIFTDEPWFPSSKVLSFGKIRGNYGITGNDQIGEYKYLDSWDKGTLPPWNGSTVLVADQLYNPNYTWEKSTKLEAGIELGFLKNRINLTVAYYKNHNGNQLLNYSLPAITGFGSVVRNQDIEFQSTGFEIALNTTIIDHKNFKWSTNAFVSIPRNKLLSNPEYNPKNLDTRIPGEPMSIAYGYRFEGMDTQTGLYKFTDVNKDGKYTMLGDYQLIDLSRRFQVTGGLSNSISLHGVRIDFNFSFSSGYRKNALLQSNFRPGNIDNLPVEILNLYWQKPGDDKPFQRATRSLTTPVARNVTLYATSDAAYKRSTVVRLNNAAISYSIPARILNKLGIGSCSVFVNGQNLLVFAPFSGKDPEVETFGNMPPMKTFVGGIQFSFK